jgi:hypothetical protein
MNPKEFDMSIPSGWRGLASPTYATSRFGRTVEFPTGTTIRRVQGSVVGGEPFADAIRVVAIDGSPFECETATVVRPDGSQSDPVEVPALWWVTAAALRFEPTPEPCGQCTHDRRQHSHYFNPGDDEPWSFCEGCGGQCEFVGVPA